MPLSYDFFISHRLAGIYRRKPRIKLLCTFFHKNALFYGAGNCRKMPRFFCAIGLQKGYFWGIPLGKISRVYEDHFPKISAISDQILAIFYVILVFLGSKWGVCKMSPKVARQIFTPSSQKKKIVYGLRATQSCAPAKLARHLNLRAT